MYLFSLGYGCWDIFVLILRLNFNVENSIDYNYLISTFIILEYEYCV